MCFNNVVLLRKVWIFGAPGVPRFKNSNFLVLHLKISFMSVNMYYFGLHGKK